MPTDLADPSGPPPTLDTTDAIVAAEQAFEIPTYSKLPVALVRGAGTTVWDADGRAYLDFYGGHCVALLGHCPPRVVEAVQAQAAQMLFYSNVVHSPVRAEAARALAALAPDGLGHVFFANAGSEANETALKIARTATGRTAVVAFEGAFHGRTLGSLATTWAPTYRKAHLDVLPDTRFVPWGDHEALRAALAPGDVAAVLIEPIQSIAGMRALPAVCVPGLRALCDAHGTKLIFDEVQTGVGRTGTFSISEQLGATPDLITLAKSLGAGVPVSATLVSDDLAATIAPGDHGSTFGGGMLAMAAVKATLDTLVADDLMARAPALFDGVADAVAGLVAEVRGRGALIGLRMERPVKPVIAALRAEGVLTGGSADPHVMRLMPPLVTSDDDIATFAAAFRRALASLD